MARALGQVKPRWSELSSAPRAIPRVGDWPRACGWGWCLGSAPGRGNRGSGSILEGCPERLTLVSVQRCLGWAVFGWSGCALDKDASYRANRSWNLPCTLLTMACSPCCPPPWAGLQYGKEGASFKIYIRIALKLRLAFQGHCSSSLW